MYMISKKFKESINYCIEQNFGGEKTLANLANHHNLPSFLPIFPMKHVVMQFTTHEARHLKNIDALAYE